jgi:hypothetical protein
MNHRTRFYVPLTTRVHRQGQTKEDGTNAKLLVCKYCDCKILRPGNAQYINTEVNSSAENSCVLYLNGVASLLVKPPALAVPRCRVGPAMLQYGTASLY